MEGNNDPVIFEHSSELDRHSIFINQMSPKVVLQYSEENSFGE